MINVPTILKKCKTKVNGLDVGKLKRLGDAVDNEAVKT